MLRVPDRTRDALPPCPPLAGSARFLHDFFLPLHGLYNRREYEARLKRLSRGSPGYGRVLRLLGRDAEAAKALARGKSPQARAFRGEARLPEDPVSALRELRAALEGRDEPQWRAWAGCGLASLGDFASARALVEGLTLPAASLLEGLLAARLEDAAGASAAFTRLLQARPRCPGAWSVRAEARLKLGDEAGAVEDAHQALSCHPENLDGFVRLLGARARLDLSRENAGPALLAAADRLARKAKAAWPLAVRAELRGRLASEQAWRASVRDLTRAAEREPRRAWVRAFLGRALSIDAGPERLEQSMAEFDAAVALDPTTGWLRSWRAEIWRRLGEPRRALADLDAGIKLDPDYRLARFWRALLREQTGDLRGAEEDLTLAYDVLRRNSIAQALARVRAERTG